MNNDIGSPSITPAAAFMLKTRRRPRLDDRRRIASARPAWAQQAAPAGRRSATACLTAPHSSADREARHLPAHARRRIARRHIRLQADAGKDARRGAARIGPRHKRLSTMVAGQTSFPIIGPLAKFPPGGKSGTMISDLMPFTRDIADDICVIRTMHTEHVNHDPASKFLHTGFQIAGRPSGGAWINYALGSNNQDLPTFIVMSSGNPGGVPIDAAAWGAGFCPRTIRASCSAPARSPCPTSARRRG